MLIGLARPTANFILAFVLMVFYFGVINEVPKYETKTTTIEWVTPGSAADQAGSKSGDIIRRFDNVDNPDWDQVNMRAAGNMGQAVAVAVDRGGQSVTLSLPTSCNGKERRILISAIWASLEQFVPGPIWVQEVQPGMPAEKAGLRAGDAIQSVDGHPFHSVNTLLAYMQAGRASRSRSWILRNGVACPS